MRFDVLLKPATSTSFLVVSGWRTHVHRTGAYENETRGNSIFPRPSEGTVKSYQVPGTVEVAARRADLAHHSAFCMENLWNAGEIDFKPKISLVVNFDFLTFELSGSVGAQFDETRRLQLIPRFQPCLSVVCDNEGCQGSCYKHRSDKTEKINKRNIVLQFRKSLQTQKYKVHKCQNSAEQTIFRNISFYNACTKHFSPRTV